MMNPVRLEECLIETYQVLGGLPVLKENSLMSGLLEKNEQHLELTADVVAAYVSNNPVPANELPSLIANLSASISALEQKPVVEEVQLSPAVSPKKSVFPDYIVSLEDGRKFKSMKRHIGLLGMTPEEYLTKWGLPADYPMVASSYSAPRSALAKTMGLGRKPKAAPEPVKAGRSQRLPNATRKNRRLNQETAVLLPETRY